MLFLFLMLCGLCEAFLLRFLFELEKEGRDASREQEGDPRRSRQAIESRESLPMNSESIQSRHKGKPAVKSAALMLAGILILTFALPLRAQDASSSAQAVPPEVMKQLETLTNRVEQLEEQLKQHEAAGQPDTVVHSAKATAPAVIAPNIAGVAAPSAEGDALLSSSAQPAKPAEPFAFADWTWLNGNARTKEPAFDSKFFTPEIRADVSYIYDLNSPRDNTIGGSSEVFRSGEVQLTQLGVGGDFPLE